MKRQIKLKYGKAEYDGIFEQNTVRGYSFKTLIAVPCEINCRTTRTHNALKVAQYLLGQEIQKDKNVFDKCYIHPQGYEYDIEGSF